MKTTIGQAQYDEDRGIHHVADSQSAKVKAEVAVIKALAEAIRELGQVPSGHLYARVMNHMSLDTYESFIDRLVGAGLVRREPSHLLVWTGPQL